MKKTAAILLAVLMAFTIVSCGQTKSSKEEAETSISGSVETSADGSDGTSSQSIGTKKASERQKNLNEYGVDTSVSVEEEKIYEDKQVEVYTKSLTFEEYGAVLCLTLKNKTTETVFYEYDCDTVTTVNDYSVFQMDINSIPGNGETEAFLEFGYGNLMKAGISVIEEVRFAFEFSDETMEQYTTEIISVQTDAYGEENSSVPFAEILQDEEKMKLLSLTAETVQEEVTDLGNGISVKTVAVLADLPEDSEDSEDAEWNRNVSLEFCFENNSDETQTAAVRNIAVNQIALITDGSYLVDIGPHSRALLSVGLNDSYRLKALEEMGIGTVSLLEAELFAANDMSEPAGDVISCRIDCGKDAGTFITGKEVYNENKIRIYAYDLLAPYGELFDSYAVLLIESDRDDVLVCSAASEAFTVNGKTGSNYNNYSYIQKGQKTLVLVQPDSSVFDDCGIESPEEIKTMDLQLELQDDSSWELLDSPVLKLVEE